MSDNNEAYPFGDKLFIGIVKLYDEGKGFGFITANNYGMSSHKMFDKKYLDFYIDSSSFEAPVKPII